MRWASWPRSSRSSSSGSAEPAYFQEMVIVSGVVPKPDSEFTRLKAIWWSGVALSVRSTPTPLPVKTPPPVGSVRSTSEYV